MGARDEPPDGRDRPDRPDSTSATGLYTLSAARTFPGLREQCREARMWARALLRPFPDAADAVELVFGEFFANAVTHTASGERDGEVFASLVGLVYGVIHLEVVDQGPRSDRPRTAARVLLPDPESTGGRGLFLAAALSKEWGRLPAEDGPGYAERGYTSISSAMDADSVPEPVTGLRREPRASYTGPMITWADFTTECLSHPHAGP
ncbi:ATP-binding protein [Streptomonospora litoralis]|uniref:Histidine kinase/HSP90-like ATPase domain-containing protein n=1 Tax=Streptomonospora litoralis TaxID=2498135 RepID=A0A4P6Q7B3_9ACTN|nr:ATP-binding protein [Streptomonospora litoralis]QBI56260.1 hypothetical protein EKD16_22535 [Streptomonospora litoralis]